MTKGGSVASVPSMLTWEACLLIPVLTGDPALDTGAAVSPPPFPGLQATPPFERLSCLLLEGITGRLQPVIWWWSCVRDEAPQRESGVSFLTLSLCLLPLG